LHLTNANAYKSYNEMNHTTYDSAQSASVPLAYRVHTEYRLQTRAFTFYYVTVIQSVVEEFCRSPLPTL